MKNPVIDTILRSLELPEDKLTVLSLLLALAYSLGEYDGMAKAAKVGSQKEPQP